MAALGNTNFMPSRSAGFETYKVGANVKIWGGAITCVDTATGYLIPGKTGTGLVCTGKAVETVDNTGGAAGALPCQVQPSGGQWDFAVDNDSGSPVTAAMVEQDCYMLDDHTVTSDSTGRSKAGTVKGIDASGKVWVRFTR